MRPIGLDGHSGEFFQEFTRGETLPFTFQVVDENGDAVDVTGFKIYVTFTTSSTCSDTSTPEIEKEMLPQDAVNGILSGTVSDDETFSLAAGTVHGSIRMIDAQGRTFVIDKARLTVGECVSPRRVQ